MVSVNGGGLDGERSDATQLAVAEAEAAKEKTAREELAEAGRALARVRPASHVVWQRLGEVKRKLHCRLSNDTQKNVMGISTVITCIHSEHALFYTLCFYIGRSWPGDLYSDRMITSMVAFPCVVY